MNADSPRLRLGIVAIVAVSLFAALFARLWYLQVLAAPDYQVAARANQQRVIVEQAPRGRILDRTGIVLVDNRTSIVVTVDNQQLNDLSDSDRSAMINRLAGELTAFGVATTVEQLEKRLVDVRFSPYTPVPVAQDVPEELEVYLKEHKELFPGVDVVAKSVRAYPYGSLAAHVIGYVGPITGDELDARKDRRDKPYELGDEIGKSGVERTYEDELRGTPGRRVLEVDAAGNTIRQLSSRAPIPGNDVQLTIDLHVQAVAEQALAEELEHTRGRPIRNGPPAPAPAGSVVVINPNDGSLVAMASYPTYDPAQFVNGIDSNEWAALQDPAGHAPLNNRAIQGEYAPGSTFKLITATAGLRSGLITAQSSITDTGAYRLNPCKGDTCVFHNAGSESHGRINLPKAITVSSDVYFYDLGARFFFNQDQFGDAIQDTARDLGLAARTGVPLPSEHDGYIPDAANKQARHDANPEAFPDERWRAGDNVLTAVGQGDVLVTPLQLANAYATFANGGTLYSPNIASRILSPGATPPDERVVTTIGTRVIRQVALPPEVRDPILQGLIGVTTKVGGTARAVFSGFPAWTVAAKTGTAQVHGKSDTALFAAFAPAEAPQYLAVAVMEESGFGGVAAAPLIRRILEPLADPTRMPEVGPGGVLSFPLEVAPDPQSDGGVTD